MKTHHLITISRPQAGPLRIRIQIDGYLSVTDARAFRDELDRAISAVDGEKQMTQIVEAAAVGARRGQE